MRHRGRGKYCIAANVKCSMSLWQKSLLAVEDEAYRIRGNICIDGAKGLAHFVKIFPLVE